MTRSKKLMFGGAALAATFAVTAFAQMPPPGGPHGPGMPMMPTTRTELQAKIAEHFKAADTNRDGFVTRAEFDAARDAMKAQFEARRGERRAEMFAMLDTNHDGSLSKDEFMARPPHGPGDGDGHDMPPPSPGAGPDGGPGGPGPMHGGRMMRHHGGMEGFGISEKWFDRADADHDGKLSLAEASAGPLAMFDRADTNHDGKISPEEHKAAFDAMRAKWRDKSPS